MYEIDAAYVFQGLNQARNFWYAHNNASSMLTLHDFFVKNVDLKC